MRSQRTTKVSAIITAGLAMALGATALPMPASAAATTVRISTDAVGRPGDGPSMTAAVSATGRYVTFSSAATNLVPDDTNGLPDLFLRDQVTGTIERINVSSTGAQANGGSWPPATISPDGRFVAFASLATNLAAGDTHGVAHIYLRDRATRSTRRVSVNNQHVPGNGNSYGVAVSANGRYVAFGSRSTNLVAGDTNGQLDVFVRDVRYGTTRLVSVAPGGRVRGNGESGFPVISTNGRYVGFLSTSTNLVSTDTVGNSNAYVKDLRTGALDLVSVSADGEAFYTGSSEMSMSADGRFVAFTANDLVPYVPQAYVRDRLLGTTVLASTGVAGTPADAPASAVSISANGRYVAFVSGARNLVPGSPHSTVVFVRDLRNAATAVGGVATSGRYIDGAQWEPAMSDTGVAFQSFELGIAPGDDERHPYQVYFRRF